MNELQQSAVERAFRTACVAWVNGTASELPNPAKYGISEELGCELAAEAVRQDAEQAASWYDEAAYAYDAVMRIA